MAGNPPTQNPLNTAASTPHFLLSNIRNLIPVRLDSTNYVQWKVQISAILRAHALFGHIDGTTPQPDQYLPSDTAESSLTATTRVINPEFLQWTYRDQALITLINATLSHSAFSHVTNATTSKQLWTSLADRYSSKTRSNILALRNALYIVQKKTSETVEQFSRRVKDIVDKLAAASVNIDDEETLLHILNGLPAEYDPFRTSIRTRSTPVTLGELEVLLDIEEKSLTKVTPALDPQPIAMAAFNGNANRVFSGGNNQRGGRSPFRGGRGGFGRGNRGGYNLKWSNNGSSQWGGRGSGNGYRNNYNYGSGMWAQGPGTHNNSKWVSGPANSFNHGHFNPQPRNPSPNQFGHAANFLNSSNQQFQQQIHTDGGPFCQICYKSGHNALDCYHRMDFAFQGRHPPAQLAAMAANSFNSPSLFDSQELLAA